MQRARAERLAVANAPCSYGAFEITVGVVPNVPDPLTLLDAVADAGYEGVDLGPVGYLGSRDGDGSGDGLAERLRARGLALAGGYLELPFSEDAPFADQVRALEDLLDIFDSVEPGRTPAVPTLADSGSPQRAALPGRAAIDPGVGLDDHGWRRLANNLARAVDRCRERGYEPTFHHHTATYVEAMWEIERLLELSDVGICLDTGHLLLGRGDPVVAAADWAGRINHVHVKDARQDVLGGIVDDSAPVEEIWKRRAFCALGEGDVDVDRVLEALDGWDYGGWIVVEQDMIPEPGEPVEQAAEEQRRNREFLRERGI